MSEDGGRWKPSETEYNREWLYAPFWFVDADASVHYRDGEKRTYAIYHSGAMVKDVIAIGNCYQTKEEAEAAAERVRAAYRG